MHRPTTFEHCLGRMAPPDQIGGGGPGKVVALRAIGGGGGASRGELGRPGAGGTAVGRRALALPQAVPRAIGRPAPLIPALGLEGGATLWTAGLEGRAPLRAGAAVGWTALGSTPLAAPAPVGTALVPPGIGGGAVGAAGLIGASFGWLAVAAPGAIAFRTAPTSTAITVEAGPTGAGRTGARPAKGAVGRATTGTTARPPVGSAIKTAGGTATGTAVWRLAHGVPCEGGGGSVFSRWSSSSASRFGFRRKSHPNIVSNPVACP